MTFHITLRITVHCDHTQVGTPPHPIPCGEGVGGGWVKAVEGGRLTAKTPTVKGKGRVPTRPAYPLVARSQRLCNICT